jgi:hypothetical protein
MSGDTPRRRVELVIDELTLLGVDRADAPAVAAALGQELASLGEERAAEAAPRGREEAVRRPSSVAASAGAPRALGRAVAAAVVDTIWETGR